MNDVKKKVAICFFGLTRSLKKTIHSIESNIFQILINHNIEYDIYLHTYDITLLTNSRSNEYNCKLDTDEWKLLKPNYYSITNQTTFDNNYDWNFLKKQGDKWNDGFQSTRNAIRQLNSIKEVTKLWINKHPYKYYLYFRPDLLYVTPLNIKNIRDNIDKPNTIVVPSWGNYLNGVNDRIAFGDYNTMRHYGNRIVHIPRLYKRVVGSIKKPYHSERYLLKIIKHFKIKITFCDMKAIRMRANYKYNPIDYKYFGKYITLNAS